MIKLLFGEFFLLLLTGCQLLPYKTSRSDSQPLADSSLNCDEDNELESAAAYSEFIGGQEARLSYKICFPFNDTIPARVLSLVTDGFPDIAAGQKTQLAPYVKKTEYSTYQYVDIEFDGNSIVLGVSGSGEDSLVEDFAFLWSGEYFADQVMYVAGSDGSTKHHFLREANDAALVGPCPSVALSEFTQVFTSTDDQRFHIEETGCRGNIMLGSTSVYVTKLKLTDQDTGSREFVGQRDVVYKVSHHNDTDTIEVIMAEKKYQINVGRSSEPWIKVSNIDDSGTQLFTLKRVSSNF